jgi:cation:H+ antiporter
VAAGNAGDLPSAERAVALTRVAEWFPPAVYASIFASSPLKYVRLHALIAYLEHTGTWAPWCFLGLFAAASFLMIWRLEALTRSGVEGTVLGTLVMPYCSGMGNLIFAFLLATKGGSGQDVLTNSLVNNVTNLTILVGIPALIWGMSLEPRPDKNKNKKKDKKGKIDSKINRLSLLLTLTAVGFFNGATWALGRDGKLDLGDGLVLVGLFLFWQCFHVFEVLKSNVRQNKSFTWMLGVELTLLALGAWGLYVSTNWLVDWVSRIHTGFISAKYLGWLSGWLMVLPNGLLAFYYARRGNPEVVYASQVGDGHISIPLCLGIFALYHPVHVPALFQNGLWLLVCLAALHFMLVLIFGRLPRWLGAVLTLVYGVFLYHGLPR